MRRLTRALWIRSLAAAATAGYLRLAFRLMRWRREGVEALPQGPVIFAFWHGRLLMMAPFAEAAGRKTTVLISRSRDGAAIAEVARRFGLAAAYGSSRPVGGADKGGSAALRTLAAALEKGECAAITPDGPRGPAEKAQGGAAALSSLSGAPVVAAAWSCRPAVRLKSWDGMLLPLPFAQAALIVSAPLGAPPEEADRAALEAHRLKIEAMLRDVTDRADLLAGRAAPLGPAPARRPAP